MDKLTHCDKMFYCCLGAVADKNSYRLYKEYLKSIGGTLDHEYGHTFAFLNVSTATDDMSLVNSFINICSGLLHDGLTVMEIHIDGDFSDAVHESIVDFAEYWLGEFMDYIGTIHDSIIFGLKPENI